MLRLSLMGFFIHPGVFFGGRDMVFVCGRGMGFVCGRGMPRPWGACRSRPRGISRGKYTSSVIIIAGAGFHLRARHASPLGCMSISPVRNIQGRGTPRPSSSSLRARGFHLRARGNLRARYPASRGMTISPLVNSVWQLIPDP